VNRPRRHQPLGTPCGAAASAGGSGAAAFGELALSPRRRMSVSRCVSRSLAASIANTEVECEKPPGRRAGPELLVVRQERTDARASWQGSSCTGESSGLDVPEQLVRHPGTAP
jgi:hypothetical protein